MVDYHLYFSQLAAATFLYQLQPSGLMSLVNKWCDDVENLTCWTSLFPLSVLICDKQSGWKELFKEVENLCARPLTEICPGLDKTSLSLEGTFLSFCSISVSFGSNALAETIGLLDCVMVFAVTGFVGMGVFRGRLILINNSWAIYNTNKRLIMLITGLDDKGYCWKLLLAVSFILNLFILSLTDMLFFSSTGEGERVAGSTGNFEAISFLTSLIGKTTLRRTSSRLFSTNGSLSSVYHY